MMVNKCESKGIHHSIILDFSADYIKYKNLTILVTHQIFKIYFKTECVTYRTLDGTADNLTNKNKYTQINQMAVFDSLSVNTISGLFFLPQNCYDHKHKFLNIKCRIKMTIE